jgi:predicted Zn-dependent peptidase
LNPHAAVAARLLSAQLEAGSLEMEMGLRLWEMADRSVLAITGTSYTRQATRMKHAVAAAVNAAKAALDEGSLATAVAEIELRYRLDAGTPGGLVEQVGRALDATDSVLGAVDYLTALRAITVSSMTAYFERLTGPLVVEFAP